MAEKKNAVQVAYRCVAILKAIVAAERERAESKLFDYRNMMLGIVEPDQSKKTIKSDIADIFNTIEFMLDYLILSRMAASFEAEAKMRLDTVAGPTRAAIQASRERSGGWAAKLVRGADSFEGLYDIGEILELTATDLRAFKMIRKIRNDFSHGMPLENVPSIRAEDARELLVNALARIK